MAKVIFSNVSQDREGWLQARLHHIGSSNAWDIVSEEGSPVRAFLDILGLADREPDNEPMRWGRRLERTVGEEFCTRYVEDNPGAVVSLETPDAMFVHDVYEWAQCTPDFFVTIDGKRYILECKTASAFMAEEWLTELPERPGIQTLHQLAVMSADRFHGAFVACLLFTPQFIYYPVEANPAVLGGLIEQERAFWDEHIVPRKAPAPRNDDGPYLNRLYEESNKEIIELPQLAFRVIEDYRKALAVEKMAKAEKSGATNDLKAMLGNADAGEIGGYTVKWTHGRTRISISDPRGGQNNE